MTTANRANHWLFAIVIALFAISGFSSLVYQVVWTRMLVFVFGSTNFASSTVLAVFMGGLALGAYVAGRYSDRIRRPFLWYGILEGIIGVWALLTPFMFDAAIPLYKSLWQSLHLSVLPFSLIRFSVAALILLVPTTCMGATLPLLSRFVTVSLDKVGDRVGTLYAVNTLGAVIGAMTAGFGLLPSIGLSATTFVAVLSNLVLLAVVVLASGKYESGNILALDPVADTAGEAKVPIPPAVIAAMVAFACSGAVAMIYEVAWTRSLLMVIGSSTYAFTVMLSTFLIGIFVGSFVCARFVDRFSQPLMVLAIAQLLVCVGGFFSLYLFNFVPYWNVAINAAFIDQANAALVVRFLLAACVLLPISLCLGAIFPLVVRTCATALQSVGRSIGTLYSANTFGAIIGAFLAGFVIIPVIGTEKALIYASLANLVIACGLVFVLNVPNQFKTLTTVVGLFALFVGLQAGGLWDPAIMLTAQNARRALLIDGARSVVPSYEEWRNQLKQRGTVRFYEDGASASVGVIQYNQSGKRVLITNGHVDASDNNDMVNQVLIGAYPMLFNPNAQQVAVVGWGAGVSLGTAAVFPNAKRVIGIEIEPAVLTAAKLFNHVNLIPEANKKVETEINDGRNYLLATDDKFDAIISEPSNPWQAGVCNLFTKEYFHVCKDRLKDDGIFGLWLQYQELSREDILHVLAALRTEFKYTLPLASSGCMVVMASNTPIHLNVDSVDQNLKSEPLGAQLAQYGITSASDVIARILCSSDVVDRLVQGVAPNTDDRNFLEYNVGKTYESRTFSDENERFLNSVAGTPWDAVAWGNRDAKSKAALMQQVAIKCVLMHKGERAVCWATEAVKLDRNPDTSSALGLALMTLGRNEQAKVVFDKAIAADPNSPVLLMARSDFNVVTGRVADARADLKKALELSPTDKMAQYSMAKTFTSAGRPIVVGAVVNEPDNPAQVLASLGDLPNDAGFLKSHPDVLLMAGMANFHMHNYRQAKEQLFRYTVVNPLTVIAWRGLGTILFEEGQSLRAADCWQRGISSGQKQGAGEISHAQQLFAAGRNAEAYTVLVHGLEYFPGNIEGVTLMQKLANSGNKQAQAAMDGITHRSHQ